MYWNTLTSMQKKAVGGIALVAVAIIVVAGFIESNDEGAGPDEEMVSAHGGPDADDDAGDVGGNAEGRNPGTQQAGGSVSGRLRFVKWTHPSGLFSTTVPAGWTIDGALGDAMDQGQFRINASSADGRSLLSFGHNWLSFMEFQYGPYLPGAATVERIVLPQFLQGQRGFSGSKVTYRSANRRLTMPTEAGIPMPFDSGTVGFLLPRTDGGFSAGTAFGETMFIASPGTPGLWRLRIFAAVIADTSPQAQADGRQAIEQVVSNLELSPQFFEHWTRSFDQTMRQMREYSAQMDRVFSRYLQSAGRSASPSGRDPLEGWATMMRGGEYAENEATGESYWVSNDRQAWFSNDRGDVVGNDTGQVPTDGGNWVELKRTGQWPR